MTKQRPSSIDLNAIAANWQALELKMTGCETGAVLIKANAYAVWGSDRRRPCSGQPRGAQVLCWPSPKRA